MVTNIALFHSYLYTDALIFCNYSQSSFTWLSFDDFDVVLILFFLLSGGGFFTG